MRLFSLPSLCLVIVLICHLNVSAQSEDLTPKGVDPGVQPKILSDTLQSLLQNFFAFERDNLSMGENLDSISTSVEDLKKAYADISIQYQRFLELVESNEGSIAALTNAKRAELKETFLARQHKIIVTADFVKSASVSLSALTLSNTLTDYLNDVSQLNNPENEELGLSLSKSITDIIDQQIFKGEKKLGKQEKPKFLAIAEGIIKAPLALLGSSPIVGALGMVNNLVGNVAVANDDVKLEDFEGYKKQVSKYMVFYEALNQASNEFQTKVNNLGIRITTLNNLLRNYAFERMETLQPESVTEEGRSLNDLLRSQYERDRVSKLIQELEEDHYSEETAQTDYGALLKDRRFDYPDYALNQARFIKDELEALSNAYVKTFYEYQNALEKILESGQDILDPQKADRKIKALRDKLTRLETAFHNAVNVEDVQVRFHKLADRN